jgi:hypothetical protein
VWEKGGKKADRRAVPEVVDRAVDELREAVDQHGPALGLERRLGVRPEEVLVLARAEVRALRGRVALRPCPESRSVRGRSGAGHEDLQVLSSTPAAHRSRGRSCAAAAPPCLASPCATPAEEAQSAVRLCRGSTRRCRGAAVAGRAGLRGGRTRRSRKAAAPFGTVI